MRPKVDVALLHSISLSHSCRLIWRGDARNCTRLVSRAVRPHLVFNVATVENRSV